MIVRACRVNKGKVPFNWGEEHQSAFTPMRKEIASAPVLAKYNPKTQTVIQTDVSINRLGASLLQDKKPLCFVSKALTDAQKGYVAIELGSLATAQAIDNFHHFLSTCHFILETDQKPLEVTASKSINQAILRLQRILFRTFLYHFTVQHMPGLTNQISDCLS